MIGSYEKENVRHHDPGGCEALQERKAKSKPQATPRISSRYPSGGREECFRSTGSEIRQVQVATKASKEGLSGLPRMTDHRLQHIRVRASHLDSSRKGNILDLVQISVHRLKCVELSISKRHLNNT